MPDQLPQGLTNKVIAAGAGTGLSAAVTTIIVWWVNTADHIVIPDYVQGAITTVVATVVAVLAGMLTRNPPAS